MSETVSPTTNTNILNLTAQIVAAHVSKNPVAPDAVAGVIRDVYAALSNVGVAPVEAKKQEPAVNPKRSVFPDYIICLEDGKKLKMLKRHLVTAYGLSPEQYREKWGLSRDYPMTAPNYATHRSELAKKIGLGHLRLTSEAPKAIAAPEKKTNKAGKDRVVGVIERAKKNTKTAAAA